MNNLRYEIRQSPQTCKKLLIMLHGYGADGHDLISLAPYFQRALPNTTVISVHAPNPCGMNPTGLEWFPLTSLEPEALQKEVLSAVPVLSGFLEQLRQEFSITPTDIALLGFSQGTMLSLSYALDCVNPPAAVVGFSGMLLRTTPPKTSETPAVMLIHGKEDTLVPYQASRLASEKLQQWNIPCKVHLREQLEHGIDPEGIALAVKFLSEHLS